MNHHQINRPNLNENDGHTNTRILQEGPVLTYDDDDMDTIKSISCEESFSADRDSITISIGSSMEENITLPLLNPKLTDVVVRFEYDAYFKDDDGDDNEVIMSEEDQWKAVQEIKDKIFTRLVKKSPLVDYDGINEEGGLEPTDIACDSLMENTLKSMLSSMVVDDATHTNDNSSSTQQRALSDMDENEWDYFLGWKNAPSDTFSNTPNCTSTLSTKRTTCRPIISSVTAQIPTIRTDLDTVIVQTQILHNIKKGFEQNAFITSSVPIMHFVGTQDGFNVFTPQDTLDDQKTSFRDRVGKVISAFGISATALLGFVTLFSCGLFGYRVSKYKKDRDLLETEGKGKAKKSKKQVLMRNIIVSDTEEPLPEKSTTRKDILHASNEGVEIENISVDEHCMVPNIEESCDVQTGFGITLGAFMDSLRGVKDDEVDSNCGSSTLDKLELEDGEYNDLLGIDDESTFNATSSSQLPTISSSGKSQIV